jgi:hypothetical protein
MKIRTYNKIRAVLLAPSGRPAALRKTISQYAPILKAIFGIGEILGGTIAAISLIPAVNMDRRAFIAIPSILMAIGSHEAKVISQNMEELTNANLIARTNAAISPKRFTHAALKETLVAKSFFGSLIAKKLDI